MLNDKETRSLWRDSSDLFAQDNASECANQNVTRNLMRVLLEEAQRCLDEGVVKTPEEIDFALLSGAGFPAFRGDLMRWAQQQVAAGGARSG